mmetsp:Transcript_7787/g.20227  ORF Transcript_7787/g.20227 Transcript_7787/m.20227 type:complete len:108 (-) Transcript_7787:296-619(-)
MSLTAQSLLSPSDEPEDTMTECWGGETLSVTTTTSSDVTSSSREAACRLEVTAHPHSHAAEYGTTDSHELVGITNRRSWQDRVPLVKSLSKKHRRSTCGVRDVTNGS